MGDKTQEIKEAVESRLLEALVDGETKTDKEGNPVTVPASAAMLNVARQYLKDFHENDEGIMKTGATKGVLKEYSKKLNLPYGESDAAH